MSQPNEPSQLPPNPLDFIAAQALAIRQMADALLMSIDTIQMVRPSSEPGGPRARERAVARSFDDDGAPVRAPVPDTTGDLRPST